MRYNLDRYCSHYLFFLGYKEDKMDHFRCHRCMHVTWALDKKTAGGPQDIQQSRPTDHIPTEPRAMVRNLEQVNDENTDTETIN